MKRLLTWASGPVLAVFFLWLTFRDADAGALKGALTSTSVPLLALCFLSGPVQLLFRSWRWGTLLEPARPRRDLPFIERLSAVSIGTMATLLPGRVGEVLRPALLSRRTGIPFGTTFATIGVERVILDLGMVLVFGAVGLLLPSRLTGIGEATDAEMLALVRGSGVVLLALAAVAAITVIVVAHRRDDVARYFTSRAASAQRRWLVALWTTIASIPLGLGALASVRGLARLAVETLIVWSVIAFGMYFGIAAAGVPIPPLGVLVMLPILSIGIGIPTPGGTGSFHFAMKIGLADLLGFEEQAALSAGIAVHAVVVLAMLAMGATFLVWGGLSRNGDADGAGAAGEAPA